MTEFIYRPRSGDRVVAEQPDDRIVVVRWFNGCRHVVGGVRLEYHAANPGEWWRDVACRAAGDIVQATGGLAWDDRGTVCLVVPAEYIRQADEVMRAIGGLFRPSMGNLGRAYRRGAANVLMAEGGPELRFGYPGPSDNLYVAVVVPGRVEVGRYLAVHPVGEMTGLTVVRAPEEWGTPAVGGGLQAAPAGPPVVEETTDRSEE